MSLRPAERPVRVEAIQPAPLTTRVRGGRGASAPGTWLVGGLALVASLAAGDGRFLTPWASFSAELAAQAPRQGPSSASEGLSDGHRRMLQALQAIADEEQSSGVYMGGVRIDAPTIDLSQLPPVQREFASFSRTGVEQSRLGNEAAAIEAFEQAIAVAARTPGEIPVLVEFEELFRLGVAYLRAGETENCIRQNRPGSCILPFSGDARFQAQGETRQAIDAFTRVVRSTLDDSPRHYEALWLLNLAALAVGDYPDRVPAAYRIPADVLEPRVSFPRFTNVAPMLQLDVFDLAGSVIVDDFDDDGYLDIVTSTADVAGQMRLFRNAGDGTFTDRTEAAGLRGLVGGLNMVQADYDNDGHVDILVLRGSWREEHGQHPNSLLRNLGDGTFTDVTFSAGLGEVHYPAHSAAWADYDGDGDLDLYVGNESSPALTAPSQLFRNDGDGTFTDVAAEAGVQTRAYVKGVAWGDYDGDRWPDLYVSNYGGPNQLYRNNGDGTFVDLAPRLGVDGPVLSFPVWFWDFDNDATLDLLVADFGARVSDVAARALGQPIETGRLSLYRGTGDGTFEDVADQLGLGSPASVMGANFGDLDNDGYLDFYLGTGQPPYEDLMPNLMYRNRGGRGFVDVTAAGGFGHLQKGHGVAFADLDNDGDQDVYEQMGGAQPGDRFFNVLFENPGFGHHWIAVKAVGVTSNRSAIGARIRVEVTEGGQRRSIYRYVNSGGSFGSNPLRQTIGVGEATSIDVLEVYWPTTGLTQTFRDVPPDHIVEVVEDASSLRSLSVEPVRLGGR